MLRHYITPFIRELGLLNLLYLIEGILKDNLIVVNLEFPLTTITQPTVKDNMAFKLDKRGDLV